MAHCAFLLAILLPILVAAAHIIGTGQLPVSSSLRRQPTTPSSPRHQPPGTRAVSPSSFKVHHQTVDTGDVSDYCHQPPEPKLKPEPAVVEDLIKRGSQAMDMAESLEHLAKVLRLFGYNTMASAAPLLADSWMLSLWSAPITLFAVPDAAIEEVHLTCPLRLVMLKHLAFGSYSFSKLSSKPSIKLFTPVFKFCMSSKTTVVLSIGGSRTKVVSINSVNIVRPELYNDGRFIIHGVKRYIELPAHGSCTRDRDSL